MKACQHCSSQFEIKDKDLQFYDKISPIFNGVKYQIPEPKLCPLCRQQRRLVFRNESNLYKRNCSMCSKNMVSIYPENSEFPVYCQECYWSDKCDAMDHATDFDFSKTFAENFNELQKKVPRVTAMITTDCENSEFTNWTDKLKNCYLIYASSECEECMYSSLLVNCQKCIDCLNCVNCQFCYECVSCSNCYNTYFSKSCTSISESAFCINCQNCEHCLFCSNLRRAKYCYKNEQLSKEEYFKKKEELLDNWNSIQNTNKEFVEYTKNIFFKSSNLINCENSSGNNLIGCKNAHECFDSESLEDCKYITAYGVNLKDCYDAYATVDGTELSYEFMSVNGGYHVLFGIACWDGCKDTFYSELLHVCNDCFGCIGLKRKKYCILNKQYTKDEYEKLIPEIIEHMKKTEEWGEFFSIPVSSFGYNETLAQEYFPLTKEEALKKGFNWSDYESPIPKVDKIIPASKLPDDIKDIPDDILNWAIRCEVTNKPYKIIPQELKFYRDHNLPIPRRHPDQRHKDRMSLRNPRKLWSRSCDKCTKEIQTTYSPERPEKILCESCYLKEVY